jgi:esterase/lipase superfamily enzyme
LPHKDKLGAIILAAPDIDVDVFKSEMRRFGKPRRPFYIVLSRDDRALALSKFIAGDENRLGADSNTKELADLGAVVIDLSQMQGVDFTNHDKFAQLAEIAPQLAPILAKGVGTSSTQEGSPGAIASWVGTFVIQPLTAFGAPITIVGDR